MSHIELEYRSEIPINDFDKHIEVFAKQYTTTSHTKRFTFMGFLITEETKINVRIRATKNLDTNKTEWQVALKKGDSHTHNRIEIEQNVTKDEFFGFIKIFNELIPGQKIVLERETLNFETPEHTVISIVKAKKHAYIEFEKLSDANKEKEASKKLLAEISNWGYTPLDEQTSKDLFNKLDNNDDMKLVGTPEELEEISKIIKSY